ncbi:MAG: biotin/lipoyl attachment protein [Flavipsychrobacter sp.]|jgi:biotin carboxyl carrier protein|nr:biotin/lipoyl attachment protein [Flavipsychrobacter sp.]
MLQLTVNDKNTFSIEQEEGRWTIDGSSTDWDARSQPNGLVSVLFNGKSYTAIVEKVDRAAKEVWIRVNGQVYKTAIKEPIDQLLANMGLDMKALKKAEPVKAPMPGLVLKVLVAPGQQINKGDGLVILEAMKMENILKATAPATVKAIKVTERMAVEKGAVLIELE